MTLKNLHAIDTGDACATAFGPADHLTVRARIQALAELAAGFHEQAAAALLAEAFDPRNGYKGAVWQRTIVRAAADILGAPTRESGR